MRLQNTLENHGRRCWMAELGPFRLSESFLHGQNSVSPTRAWLQVPSPGLCPNDRFRRHCSLPYTHVKLILITEEVSGKHLMVLAPFNGINTLCGTHFRIFACSVHILKNIVLFQKNHTVLAINARFCKLRNELCQIVLPFFSLLGLFAM